MGNIAGAVVTAERRAGLLLHHGTLGLTMPRLQGVVQPWPDGAILVLHSDGLTGRWDLSRYRALGGRDPAVIAGLLYRDFKRGNDDCTVVVGVHTADSAPGR